MGNKFNTDNLFYREKIDNVMDAFNYYNPKNKKSEDSHNKIISYLKNINLLLDYIADFDPKNCFDENELEIYTSISCLSGAFLGDSMGSYCVNLPPSEFNENTIWSFYNPIFGTSKGQISDSCELALSLSFGLIDSNIIDLNLICFYYHYWFYSNPFNIERTLNNSFSLYKSELKIFNKYIKNQSNLAEICKKNAKTYNDGSLSNTFLMRISPLGVYFFYNNKNIIIDCLNMISNKKDEISSEKLFNLIYEYIKSEVTLTHSYSENCFAGSLYVYILSIALTYPFLKVNFNFNTEENLTEKEVFEKKQSRKSLKEYNLTEFDKCCENILFHLKFLLNCEFIKMFYREKNIIDIIKKIGINMKNLTLSEMMSQKGLIGISTENKDNYSISIKLIILILFYRNDFKGSDFITEEMNKSELVKVKNNTFRNIINFICQLGGETNRNCTIVGAVFGAVLGFKNLGNIVNDMYRFIPSLGYSVVENNRLVLKNFNDDSNKMIKYRPFMYSPGVIGLWAIYIKAKIDNLNK